MRVEDNGVGFQLEEALRRRDSFGLSGMRERVVLVGGTLRVISRPGRGTCVVAELPLEAARSHSRSAADVGRALACRGLQPASR